MLRRTPDGSQKIIEISILQTLSPVNHLDESRHGFSCRTSKGRAAQPILEFSLVSLKQWNQLSPLDFWWTELRANKWMLFSALNLINLLQWQWKTMCYHSAVLVHSMHWLHLCYLPSKKRARQHTKGLSQDPIMTSFQRNVPNVISQPIL
jgi:hypothetical protein